MSDILTAERITELLSQTRTRGGNERFIRAFVDSDEMYAIVTDNPQYKGKNVNNTKNALTQKVKDIGFGDTVRLLKVDADTLAIVNTSKVAEASDE